MSVPEEEQTILSLPAPSDTQKVEISTDQITQLKFDQLGPMVINSDGTLSRITNWENMTEPERERTIRVLNARNRLRLAQEKEKTEDPSETVTLTGP